MQPQQIKTRGVITGIPLPTLMQELQRDRQWTIHGFTEDQDKQVGKVSNDQLQINRPVNLTSWLNRPNKIHIQGRFVTEFLTETEGIRSQLLANTPEAGTTFT